MKKIANYIFTILLIFSFSACEDYLKEERYTDVGYDYLKTKVGMEAAVTGVYQDMRWYTGAYNQEIKPVLMGVLRLVIWKPTFV